MSTINIYYSAFSNKYETIHETENRAIKDIVKDDLDNAVIFVEGFQKDKQYILKDDELCTIRIFPKAPVGIAVGIMIFVAASYLTADQIVKNVTGKSILDHAKEGLVKWLAGDVNSDSAKQPNPLESIPQLRGAKNQSAYDKPYPFIMGKHLFTPFYVGKPYTTIGGTDGEDQYFHALFILGYSKLKVTDIKLGEIQICSNKENRYQGPLVPDGQFSDNDPQLELQQGANEVSLYTQKVYEEQLSIELMNVEGKDNHVVRFSAQNPQKVQVEFTFNGGLISYNDDGSKKDATVTVTVQWRGSGTDAWNPFGTLNVTRQKAKVRRFVLEKTFAAEEILPVPGRTIELRIVRTTPDDPNDTRTSDTVYVSAIRTWCFDYEQSQVGKPLVPQLPMIEKDRDRTCRLGITLKASDKLSGMINAINCIVQSCGRTWNGTAWTPDTLAADTPTQNPASIALKAMQSPMLGRHKYPDSKIDLDSFGEFSEWCTTKGCTCNGVVTAEKRLDELLDAIVMTGRGMRILNGNQYGILIDKPRTNPVTVLNNHNVLERDNQKDFEALPDGYKITFIDETDGYKENELYAMKNDKNKPGPDSVIESIEMPFVTNRDQAFKNGLYQYACRKLRPEVWHRKLSIDGNLLYIGCLVEIQDDTLLVGMGEGAVITALTVEHGAITKIHTDGRFDVTDTTKLYGIKIMQFDGVNPGTVRTIQVPISAAGVYRDFTVDIPVSGTQPVPHVGDLVSFGIYDRITTNALCFGKKDNGDGTFDITLIPYQEGIYTADTGVIPEFDSKLTPPQGLAGIPEVPKDTVTKDEARAIARDFVIPGPPTVVYELKPAVDVIIREAGGTLIPPSISCSQVRITGDSPPEVSHKTITYSTSENEVPELYTGAITVGTWNWIEFILSDHGLELDRERVPVLKNGTPATIYEVFPSVTVISRDDTGVSPDVISCEQKAVTGNGGPVTSDKLLRYATSLTEEADYTGTITINPNWDWIEFRLYDTDDTRLDSERIPILSKGPPAEVYELQPDVSVIKHEHDGTLIPQTISCAQYQFVTGYDPVVSHKTLKYRTSLDSEERPYPGALAVLIDWQWVEFRLYDENTVLLDTERVPVLADGFDGTVPAFIDLSNEYKLILCDEDGIPYANELPAYIQGVFYNENAAAVSNNMVFYPTDHGAYTDPMLEGMYPFESNHWYLVDNPSGVRIDTHGRITIDADAALQDETVVTVKYAYKDKDYEARLTIGKVRSGVSPIIIDLTNNNVSVECTQDGEPYADAFPIYSQAVLYRGNRQEVGDSDKTMRRYASDGSRRFVPDLGDFYPITEARTIIWSLEHEPSGVRITDTGLIIVSHGEALEDFNEITVKALYRGKIHPVIMNITKVYDGQDPLVLDFDNQNKGIACLFDGTPKTGQLPGTVRASLYRGTVKLTTDIVWTISGAPVGVTINGGVITIGANAALAMSNEITVQAVWTNTRVSPAVETAVQGVVKILKVLDGEQGDKGDQGDPAPHYLGKTYEPGTNTGLANIKASLSSGDRWVQAHEDDWVAYVGTATTGIWVKGYCYRWKGGSWGRIEISADGNFDTNPYVAALMDLTEGAGDGTFMSVFVRDLIAKTAMIEYIASHKLHIQTKDGNAGAIYGGDKYTADGVDTDPTGLLGKKGFWLDTNGLLKAGGIQTQGAFNGAVDIVDEMRFYQATGGSLVNRGNLKVGALAGIAGLIGLIITSGFIACDTMYTKVETSGSVTGNSGVTNWLNAVAYGGGLFVAVGDTGTIITSPDGTSWTSRNSGTEKYLYDVAYGGGLFVTLGMKDDMGTIVTSPDGTSWKVLFDNVFVWRNLRAVAYGKDKFVAVGVGGTIITSPDGVTWTAMTSGITTNLNGVAYGGGLFVVVGANGTIITSPDGTSWTSRNSGIANPFYNVIYSQNMFVVVGLVTQYYSSPDGITWTSRPLPFSATGVAYGNDKFVAVGVGGLISSFVSGASTQKVGAGFTQKILDGDSTKYRLFDGRTIKLNSNGSVTWE